MGLSARRWSCMGALLLAVFFPSTVDAGNGHAQLVRKIDLYRAHTLHAYLVTVRCPSQWNQAKVFALTPAGPKRKGRKLLGGVMIHKESLLEFRESTRIEAITLTNKLCSDAPDDKGKGVYLPLNFEADPDIAMRDTELMNLPSFNTEEVEKGAIVDDSNFSQKGAMYLALELVENRCPSQVSTFLEGNTFADLAQIADTSGRSLVDMTFNDRTTAKRKLLGGPILPPVIRTSTIYDYRFFMCSRIAKIVDLACNQAMDDVGQGSIMPWLQALGCDGMEGPISAAVALPVLAQSTPAIQQAQASVLS